MITQLLLTPIFALVSFIINLIPAFETGGFVFSGLETLANLWATVSYFIPINLLLASIAFLLLVDSWNHIVYIINWLIKKIPTI